MIIMYNTWGQNILCKTGINQSPEAGHLGQSYLFPDWLLLFANRYKEIATCKNVHVSCSVAFL